jgi:hypothetical protein
LKIVNGFLRACVVKGREQAILDVNERLGDTGLVAFDPHNEADRTKAIGRTIGVSLDFLDESGRVCSGRARFSELGIFPEDADIPIGVVERLWAKTNGLKKSETKDILIELYDLQPAYPPPPRYGTPIPA